MPKAEPARLNPLTFDEAIKGLINVDPDRVGLIPNRRKLKDILRPPVNQSGKNNHQHPNQSNDPAHNTAKTTGSLQAVQTGHIQYQCCRKQKCGINPKHRTRLKRFCAYIRRNVFNALLTLFTATYALSFAFATYVTERAYIVFGSPDGTLVFFIPTDAGLQLFFANTGRTPARNVVDQFWLLQEREIVVIQPAPQSVSHHDIPPGYPQHRFLIWPEAKKRSLTPRLIESGNCDTGRITFDGVSYRSHCVEFVASYMPSPINEFVPAGILHVCDPSDIKSVRYNRVCVPTTDRKSGVWVILLKLLENPHPEKGEEKWNQPDPTPCFAEQIISFRSRNHTQPPAFNGGSSPPSARPPASRREGWPDIKYGDPIPSPDGVQNDELLGAKERMLILVRPHRSCARTPSEGASTREVNDPRCNRPFRLPSGEGRSAPDGIRARPKSVVVGML